MFGPARACAKGLRASVGAGFPEEGRVLTEPDDTLTVRGTGPVAAQVKGIYQKKGKETGGFGPTYDVVLLP
jgi:hypothetical protein